MIRYYFTAYISGGKETETYIIDTCMGAYEARYMAGKKIKKNHENKTFILVLENQKMLIPA